MTSVLWLTGTNSESLLFLVFPQICPLQSSEESNPPSVVIVVNTSNPCQIKEAQLTSIKGSTWPPEARTWSGGSSHWRCALAYAWCSPQVSPLPPGRHLPPVPPWSKAVSSVCSPLRPPYSQRRAPGPCRTPILAATPSTWRSPSLPSPAPHDRSGPSSSTRSWRPLAHTWAWRASTRWYDCATLPPRWPTWSPANSSCRCGRWCQVWVWSPWRKTKGTTKAANSTPSF